MYLDTAADCFLPQIEAELRAILEMPDPALAPYYGMMHYHLGWVDHQFLPVDSYVGKRIRPLLCLLSAQAAGGSVHHALPAAAAVELVHSFSLVHDDIQDDSPIRRGRPAVWAVWGVAQAITVGDGIFVHARRALQRLQERGVPDRRSLAAFRVFDDACLALCEGQFLDIEFSSRPGITQEQYLTMVRGKTSALLAASAQLGAIVATDDLELIERHTAYGQNLGTAFQIQDDILGIWGDENLMGKSAATDLRDRKKTLPVVFALNQQEHPRAAERLSAIYSGRAPLSHQEIEEALKLLERVNARRSAQQLADAYYRKAFEQLEAFDPARSAYAALHELAKLLMRRRV
jgi:geranylgeranyl diphosphate synthase type I